MLWTAADVARAGGDVADGAHGGDFLEGYEVRFVEVRPHWYAGFLGYAQWFNESAGDFPVLQLVWPDADGRFPWEPACSLTPGTQLVLGPPPDP